MKKTLTIMLILCIAASVFAVGSVKVGGVFDHIHGKTVYFEDKTYGSKVNYKTFGFGFDVSGKYDVADNLAVWADFNMTFGKNLALKYDGTNSWLTLNDLVAMAEHNLPEGSKVEVTAYNLSASAGVAVKLPVASNVDVAVGGGVFFNRVFAKVAGSVPENTNATHHYESQTLKYINLGITAYADATYKFTENIGVSVTVMPRLGIYNIAKHSHVWDKESPKEYKANGFSLSFSTPIAVGVSYSF